MLAQSLEDRQAQARIYWNLMLQGTYGAESAPQIVTHGETAVAIAREEGLREVLAYALNDLARPYTQVGEMGKAAAVLEEAGQLWRELGNRPMLADNRATLASGYRFLGRLEEALELAREALAISRETGSYWGEAYSLNVMSPILMDLGRIDEALASWHLALPMAEKANFIGGQAFVRIDLGLAYGRLGDTERGLALAEEARRMIHDRGQTQLAYYPLLAQARLHLYDGKVAESKEILAQIDEAADLLRENISTAGLLIQVECQVSFAAGRYSAVLANLDEPISAAQKMEMSLALVDLRLLQGQALLGLERTAAAAEVLEQARQLAQSLGAKKVLWQILDALAAAAGRQGQAAEAQALRRESEAVKAFIAGNIADDHLRHSFLQSASLTQSQ